MASPSPSPIEPSTPIIAAAPAVQSLTTVPCYKAVEAVSNGILQGNNPLDFALPLLVIQIVLVVCVTRAMAFLVRPIKQPRVLAEIIGGVLLGPSAFGHFKPYLNTIFPKQSMTTIDTVSNFGLVYFLFMVGMELDLKEVLKSGKAAVLTALAGIAVPFCVGIGMAYFIQQQGMSSNASLGPLSVFLGIPFSISAFAVLIRIMAEKKILTSELGRLAVPTAAINDVCAWVMLAVGVAIAGTNRTGSAFSSSKSKATTPAIVLVCCFVFVAIMLLVVKRIMEGIARRVNRDENGVSEVYVCLTLIGVLVCGFITEIIGIHPLFGAFVFGIVIPKEGKFAQAMTEKIEDFVNVLFLPLFFASSGLKTDLTSINTVLAVKVLLLLVLVASASKILVTALGGFLLKKMDFRDSMAFGFLMNTKGLSELIVLNIGKEIGVLDEQTFAILIVMCLVMLFFTTPAVTLLLSAKTKLTPYPNRNRKIQGINFASSSSSSKDSELRVLACLHSSKNASAIVNLIEACRGADITTSPTSSRSILTRHQSILKKLYVMHLIQLTERTSSLIGLFNSVTDSPKLSTDLDDNVLTTFKTYARFTKLPVKFSKATSHFHDMHLDICTTAEESRANIILLPLDFYRHHDGSVESIRHGSRTMNLKVLEHAPCSVGILFDKAELWGSADLAFGGTISGNVSHNVAVLFFGGPDDREALAVGLCVSRHPMVNLSVIRFVKKGEDEEEGRAGTSTGTDSDDGLDEECLMALRGSNSSELYKEIMYDDSCNQIEMVVSALKSNKHSLVIVGREAPGYADGHHRNSVTTELGVLGDALASPVAQEIRASLLVVQQYKPKEV